MIPIVKIALSFIRQEPNIELTDLLKKLDETIVGFSDPRVCVNCEASLFEYEQFIDVNDAMLIYSMARIVRGSISLGVPFTEANKVRVSISEEIPHIQKGRTTRCSKAGLIAKAGAYGWSITRLGWAAMRGEPIDRERVTYRGQIIERPTEKTSFPRIFAEHTEKMQRWIAQGKALKNDHRWEFKDYNPNDWISVGGFDATKI